MLTPAVLLWYMTNNMAKQDLLSVTDVADMTGLSRQAVHQACSGESPALCGEFVGGVWIFDRADVVRWLATRAAKAQEAASEAAARVAAAKGAR